MDLSENARTLQLSALAFSIAAVDVRQRLVGYRFTPCVAVEYVIRPRGGRNPNLLSGV
jgi:hypothetical protein